MTRDTASSLVSGRGRKLEHIRGEGSWKPVFQLVQKPITKSISLKGLEGLRIEFLFHFQGSRQEL